MADRKLAMAKSDFSGWDVSRRPYAYIFQGSRPVLVETRMRDWDSMMLAPDDIDEA